MKKLLCIINFFIALHSLSAQGHLTPPPLRTSQMTSTAQKTSPQSPRASQVYQGKKVIFHLYIKDTLVNFTGKTKRAIAVNGQIPMPTLTFTEGDTAVIYAHNELNESTSLHWHGLMLPNRYDGVPNLTQMPIKPHTTFLYEFPIIQHGTHWYHSHSGLQEQIGMYGSFVMNKAPNAPNFRKGIDDLPTVPLILSEWTDMNPENVHRMLHNATDWFAIKKGTTQSYAEAIKQGYFKTKIANEWKRMNAMDVSDVYYEKFLINGKEVSTLMAPSGVGGQKGDKVRLRISNGGASTYFWLTYGGGKMTVVASDGNDVEPVEVDRLIVAVSETYDIIVTIPTDNKAYAFLATSEDRVRSTALFLGDGVQQAITPMPRLKYFEGMKMMNGMMKMNGNLDDMGMNMSLNQMDMNVVMYPEITGEIKPKAKHNMKDMKKDDPKMEDMKKGDHKMKDMKKDDPKMDNMKKGDHKMEDMKKDDPKVNDMKKGDHKMEDMKKDDPKMDNMKKGDHKMKDMKKDEPKMDNMKKGDHKMEDMKKDDSKMDNMKKGDHKMEDMKKDDPKMDNMKKGDHKMEDMKMGAEMYNANAISDITTLNYAMLKSPTPSVLPQNAPIKELHFELTGNMNRYVWSLDNKVVSEADKILIKKGENIRMIVHNNSMMRHPMHLHGHDFRILNGQGDNAPMKNIVDIMPMETDTLEFNANVEGDWFFHCHILYHMMSGMGRVFTYQNQASNPFILNPKLAQRRLFADDREFHAMASIGLESNGTDGEAMLSNTRWKFSTLWHLGLHKFHGYESETMIGRYFGKMQWLYAYSGFDYHYKTINPKEDKNIFGSDDTNMFGQISNKNNRKTAVVGITYTLPMLIMADLRLDGDGKFRFQLMREDIPIAKRFRMSFMLNTDKEYMLGGRYILGKNISVSSHYDSDMSIGAGITFNY